VQAFAEHIGQSQKNPPGEIMKKKWRGTINASRVQKLQESKQKIFNKNSILKRHLTHHDAAVADEGGRRQTLGHRRPFYVCANGLV